MNENNQKQDHFSKGKKTLKIIDHKKTQTNIRNQLSIVRKVVCSISWFNKDRLADSLIYLISVFIFPNPLCFNSLIFKHVNRQKLTIDSKKSYILVNSHVQLAEETNFMAKSQYFLFHKSNSQIPKRQNDLSIEFRQLDSIKQGQYAINIKVIRFWKSCKINYASSSLRQIINKSKHFIDFLKNIKIDNPKNQNQNQTKSFQTSNYQDKQSKLFTLVSENYDYVAKKITEIQQNQKHKKLDHSIAKTYVEMMNKNILILSVQKNNLNPISYKSQGKYVYVQNSLKLPLVSQRFNRIYSRLQSYKIQQSQTKVIPYLQYSVDGEWTIKNASLQKLELFQQNGKQIDRGQGFIIDRFLNCFYYDDYLVYEL